MKRVLVVDDEIQVLHFVEAALENEGYEIVICQEAQKAVQFYTDESFDVVITDILMPGMSGLELCEKLMDICSDARVILITGAVEADGFRRQLFRSGRRNGGMVTLNKPVSAADLKKAVSSLLELDSFLEL